jgi:mRNA interferase RelE/StbE
MQILARIKQVRYSLNALNALRKHRADAERIKAKIQHYAATGAGDVKRMAGRPSMRLRVGDFRVIFVEDRDFISVTEIGPRGSIYK